MKKKRGIKKIVIKVAYVLCNLSRNFNVTKKFFLFHPNKNK